MNQDNNFFSHKLYLDDNVFFLLKIEHKKGKGLGQEIGFREVTLNFLLIIPIILKIGLYVFMLMVTLNNRS